jgi:hypothetical protein
LIRAAAAPRAGAARAQVSSDGWWYWDGRLWQPAVTTDGRWRWDGRGWIPLRNGQLKSARARGNLPASLLIGLLILDLVGFVPGVSFLTSVLAATVLLGTDPRGFVTLNGFIKWRRMWFRQKVLVACLEVTLFQFLVLGYIAQRLYGMAKGALRRGATDPSSSITFDAAEVDSGTSTAPIDADGIDRALNTLLSEARSGLPQELLDKVRSVASPIRDILPAYRASGLGHEDRFVVERTATDYLPGAVHSYLKLPAAFRSVPLPDANGNTASEVLSDQLDLLIQRMRQVASVAYRMDLEALLVHGRFLHSKFGPSGLELDS